MAVKACILLLFFSSVFAADTNKLDAYIRKTLENLREKMVTGVPQLGMPRLEPLKLPTISQHIKEGIAEVDLKLMDLTVKGISKFNVRKVRLDLASNTLELGIFLPSVTAVCKYDLNGKILVFPLYGKGPGQLQVVDFDLNVKTQLKIGSKIQMTDLMIKINTGKISVNLEGLLGGGNLGALINTAVSLFGKKLFDKHKGGIERMLNGVIRNVVNKELGKVNPADLLGKISFGGYAADNKVDADAQNKVDAEANSYVDNLLTNVRPQLKKYDPMSLPYMKKSFSKKVGLIKFKGYAELRNGTLQGLSTLHREGNVTLSTESASGDLKVDASLGVNNVQVTYKCKLKFMSIKIYPHITGTVRAVNAHTVVKANLVKKTNLCSPSASRRSTSPQSRSRTWDLLTSWPI